MYILVCDDGIEGGFVLVFIDFIIVNFEVVKEVKLKFEFGVVKFEVLKD